MADYKLGLDFGTHQSKVCLEDSSDRRNKSYFFHRFIDDRGNEQFTLPSVVMVKKDRTLAYGCVDEKEALNACILPATEEPSKPKLLLWSYPTKPVLPVLPEQVEQPQPPDFDVIKTERPKPTAPQEPVFQSQPKKKEKTQVFHDLHDIGSILNEQSPNTSNNDGVYSTILEYMKAQQRYRRDLTTYSKELRAYNSWLEKRKRASKLKYEEQLRNYNKKLAHYKYVQSEREKIIEKYEKQCREVDTHNEQMRKNLKTKMAEYEEALQKWIEEKKRPQPLVMKYFKQALFSSNIVWRYKWSPMQVSIWYLTNLFFELDEKYGTENLMVMIGTSSGSQTWNKNKEIATQLILTVYHLIEDVFHHDRQSFLRCTVDELVSLTNVVAYSQEAKQNNSIYVFPEAYVNLNPMALSGKFGYGMNMLVDIGGGTTDISLFSSPQITDEKGIKKYDIKIYDFISVPNGLNAVDIIGVKHYKSAVSKAIYDIVSRIKNHARYIGVPNQEIDSVLQKRPIVFTGGGSTRKELCCEYAGFSDIKHLRNYVGRGILIDERRQADELMAILSTALGLAMCKEDDSEIHLQTERELFKDVEEAYSSRFDNSKDDHNEHGLADW